MAVTFHTLTGDVTDILGADFPLNLVTGATLESNLTKDAALVADGKVRIPSLIKVDIQADGTFSAANLVASDSADTNIDPATPLLYRVTIRYRHPQTKRPTTNGVAASPSWSSPWFELNGSGTTTLANVIEVAYLPASLISQATATLEAARDDAVADVQAATTGAVTARNEAEGFADDAAASAAAADALVISDLGTTDGQTRALIESPSSQTRAALAAQTAAVVDVVGNRGPGVGLDGLRAAVRAGFVTTVRPWVFFGDSHTDATTSAMNLRNRIRTLQVQPGQGFEGLEPNAIQSLGYSGITGSILFSDDTRMAALVALNPSVVAICLLTNDVRLGALGLTVDAIRSNGSAVLDYGIRRIKSALPSARIVLRIPFPYTTVDAGQGYIRDAPGGTVNPAGLAQTYTNGVRLAHYDVQALHGDVVIYDPQTRFAGTTSPTANGGSLLGYYGDQIHQNNFGYIAEADDMAAWLAAEKPYQPARVYDARTAGDPTSPWLAYYREVEDPDFYTLIGEGRLASAVAAGATNFTVAPARYALGDRSHTSPRLVPGNLARGDFVELVGAETTWRLPTSGPAFAWSAANVLLTGVSVPAAAAANTRVRFYRRIAGTDLQVNGILRDTSWRYKRTGIVQGGGTTFVDLEARSFSASQVPSLAAVWATEAQAGDKVYVEDFGATPPITLAASGAGAFAASGNSLRITGLSGTDWSTKVGKMVVLVGTHA